MKSVCFGDSNTYGYDPRSWCGSRYDEGSRRPYLWENGCPVSITLTLLTSLRNTVSHLPPNWGFALLMPDNGAFP